MLSFPIGKILNLIGNPRYSKLSVEQFSTLIFYVAQEHSCTATFPLQFNQPLPTFSEYNSAQHYITNFHSIFDWSHDDCILKQDVLDAIEFAIMTSRKKHLIVKFDIGPLLSSLLFSYYVLFYHNKNTLNNFELFLYSLLHGESLTEPAFASTFILPSSHLSFWMLVRNLNLIVQDNNLHSVVATPHGKTQKHAPRVLPDWFVNPSANATNVSKGTLKQLITQRRYNIDAYDRVVHFVLRTWLDHHSSWKEICSHKKFSFLFDSLPASGFHLYPASWRDVPKTKRLVYGRVFCVPTSPQFLSTYKLQSFPEISDLSTAILHSENESGDSIFSSLTSKFYDLWNTIQENYEFYSKELMSSLGRMMADGAMHNIFHGPNGIIPAKTTIFFLLALVVASVLARKFIYKHSEFFLIWLTSVSLIVCGEWTFGVSLGEILSEIVKHVNHVRKSNPLLDISVLGLSIAYAFTEIITHCLAGQVPSCETAVTHGLYLSSLSTPQSWLASLTLIERMYGFAMSIYKRVLGIPDTQGLSANVAEVITECNTLLTTFNEDKYAFSRNQDLVDSFLRNFSLISQIAHDARASKPENEKAKAMLASMRLAELQFREIGAYKLRAKTIRPATVFLKGPTRIGKSTLIRHLHERFYSTYPFGFSSAKAACYTRTTDTFWSDYGANTIIDFDDFGALTDTASVPNPNFLDLLNLCSDNAVALPMAFIKGGVYSNAKLVTASLNHEQRVCSLSNGEAINARQDIFAELYVDYPAMVHDGVEYMAKPISIQGSKTWTYDESQVDDLSRLKYLRFQITRCLFSDQVGRVLTYRQFNGLFDKIVAHRLECKSSTIAGEGVDMKELDKYFDTIESGLKTQATKTANIHGVYEDVLDNIYDFFAPNSNPQPASGKMVEDFSRIREKDEEEPSHPHIHSIYSQFDFSKVPTGLGGDLSSYDQAYFDSLVNQPPLAEGASPSSPSGYYGPVPSQNCETTNKKQEKIEEDVDIPEKELPSSTASASDSGSSTNGKVPPLSFIQQIGKSVNIGCANMREQHSIFRRAASVLIVAFEKQPLFMTFSLSYLGIVVFKVLRLAIKTFSSLFSYFKAEDEIFEAKPSSSSASDKKDHFLPSQHRYGPSFVLSGAYKKSIPQPHSAKANSLYPVDNIDVVPCDEFASSLLADTDNASKITQLLSNKNVSNIYTGAVYALCGKDNNGKVLSPGIALAVNGSYMLVNRHVFDVFSRLSEHYLVGWKSFEHIRVFNVDGPRVDVNTSRGDSQVVYVPEIGAKRNILSHFLSFSEINRKVFDLVGVFPLRNNNGNDWFTKALFCFNATHVNEAVTVVGEGERFNLESSLVLQRLTDPGDCGAPVVHVGGDASIIGVVTAGNEAHTFVQVVSRENLSAAIEQLRINHPYTSLPDLTSLGTFSPPKYPERVAQVMEALATHDTKFVEMKTKLKRNMLSTWLQRAGSPSCKFPRNLLPYTKADGTRIFPRDNATKKLLIKQPQLDPADRLLALGVIARIVPSCASNNINKKVLTEVEACAGTAYNTMKAIDLSTSAGYPYCIHGVPRRDLFELDVNGCILSLRPKLQEALNDFKSRAIKGKAPAVIFIDVLKDELGKPEKLDTPRPYSIGPLTLLVLSRQYFGSYFAALRASKITNGICIGTNVFGEEWKTLYTHLTSLNADPNVRSFLNADVANFDASLMAVFTQAIFSSIIEWYDDDNVENTRIRWAIANNIVYSIHLNLDQILAWRGNNPSGCPITAELNSIYSVFIAEYCFKKLYKRDAMRNDMVYATYGDDVVQSFGAHLLPNFSVSAYCDAALTIGIKLTTADKKPLTELVSIDEVEFLKRSFRYSGNFIVAPLDKVTIKEVVHWTRQGSVDELGQRLHVSLVEASLHGKEFYNQWRGLLASAVAKAKITLNVSDAKILHNKWDASFALAREQGFQDSEKLTALLSVPLQEVIDEGHAASSNASGIIQTTKEWFASPQSNSYPKLPFGGNSVAASFDTNLDALWLSGAPNQINQPNENLGIQKLTRSGYSNTVVGQFKQFAILQSSSSTSFSSDDSQTSGMFVSTNPVSNTETGNTTYSESPTSTIPEGAYTGVGDVHQVVRFRDNDITKDTTARIGAIRGPLSGMSETKAHEIGSFLARPYKVGNYTVDSTTGTIANLSLDNLLSQPGFANKFAGFVYNSMDLHFKVVVNANRFALGRLIIAHTPYESFVTFNRQLKVGETDLLTTFPYLDIDLGANESGTLNVPFCSLYPWNVASDTAWSQVKLAMLSPFAGTNGAETCTVTVFAWADNVQLSIPKLQSASSKEMEDKTKNIVRPAINAVRDISGALTNVPLVSDLAIGVNWAAALADKAASLFGYSKPLNVDAVSPYQNIPAKGFTNVEGSDGSVSLSLRANNSISSCAALDLCSEDAMSFAHFFSRMQKVRAIAWSTSDPSESIIFNEFVSDIFDDRQAYWSGIAELFQFERGGLVLRLSAVKNPFYSGRLSIEFVTDSSSAPLQFEPNIPSIVWDVAENKEIYVRIPYVAPTRLVRRTIDSTRGSVVVRVINELRAEDTMPQTIQLMLFAAPTQDLSYASPANPNLAYPHGLASPEAGVITRLEASNQAHPLLDVPLQTQDSLAITMGEPLMSLRDIIKRFCFLYTYTGDTQSLSSLYFDPVLYENHPLHIVSGYFAFCRGSMRYKFVLRNPPTDVAGNPAPHMMFQSFMRFLPLGPPSTGAIYPFTSGDARCAHITFPLLNPIHEISIPYFVPTDRFLVSADSNLPDVAIPAVCTVVSYDTTIYTNPPTFDVYQAAGDDFSFSFPKNSATYV